MTKKEILNRLNDIEDVLTDPRFTADYKITETRARLDVIYGSLRKELSGFKV